MDQITQVFQQIFGEHTATIILAVIGVCAIVAAQLPAPNTNTTWGKIYAPIYTLLQWWAQNYRYAKNASADNGKKSL